MFWKWLKRYSPRGIYGRAALILLVPMVVLFAIVSVGFVQRHYERVTLQMTASFAYDVNLVLARINQADNLVDALSGVRALAIPLQIAVTLPDDDVLEGFSRAWYDFSGPTVFEVLKSNVGNIRAVSLDENHARAIFWVETKHGTARFSVRRGRISAANPHQFLVLTLVTIILMIIIIFVFMRNQLRPIRRLARAAEAFGRGQSVDYHPSGAAEVRLAGNAFLSMRARIERQIDQRTLMLSGVSHDLRTPLTRMRLALSMMEERDDVAELTRDIDDMERLLDEFLAFARGDALDDPQEVSPSEYVTEIVRKSPHYPKRIVLDESAPVHSIMLRPVAIERAIDNLVSNAMRYANNASVSLRDSSKALVIAVEDDGPGIPPEEYEEAMKPFVRLDRARNQDLGSGVGLGLAIANDIARRHGGALRLGNSAKMGGLMAEIVIPR